MKKAENRRAALSATYPSLSKQLQALNFECHEGHLQFCFHQLIAAHVYKHRTFSMLEILL